MIINNNNSRLPVLVVPALGPGRGGGHLVRSAVLVRELRALGREALLYIPAASASAAAADAVPDTARFDRSWIIDEDGLRDKSWHFIILDRFQTPAPELARWKESAPVIGIDEGGKSRDRFDFLIDLLPNLSKIAPNIFNPSLLPLPEKKPRPRACSGTEPLKVLISFGHEDRAGLGPVLAGTLANYKNTEITLLKGKLTREKDYSRFPVPGVLLRDSVPNLNEHLTDYDLVITHYGLTSFEALYAGVPVLPASPTAYHEKLAKKAGFLTLGTGGKKAVKKISALFKNDKVFSSFLSALKTRCDGLAVKFGLDREPRQSLAGLINGFSPNAVRGCLVCGAALSGSARARFPERGYIRCKFCGAISMNRINPVPVEYDRDYFFEQYKKQYGKTYIEDFPNLTAMAKRRLAVIRKIGGGNKASGPPKILDIGCAYGAFLAAAKEEGYAPYGMDPAEDAVRYVTQTPGIAAVRGCFPAWFSDSGLPASGYDVITLWYVIEHFGDCVPALAEIRKLLKPGGVLAFATPSFTGISGRSSLKRFLEHGPQDHRTVWSPAVCRKALVKAGFKVKKIVSTGHHPGRFPFLGKFARDAKSPLYGPLLAASKFFSLGDTVEVFAVTVTNVSFR